MRHILRFAGCDHHAALTGPDATPMLLLDDAVLTAELIAGHGHVATLQLDGASTKLRVAESGDTVFIWLDGEVYEAEVMEPLAVHAREAGAATGLQARAPMPGSVVAIPVAVGDVVAAGDTLVIIESMKLEVSLKAGQPGRVAGIHCALGKSFEKDAVLVDLAAEEAA